MCFISLLIGSPSPRNIQAEETPKFLSQYSRRHQVSVLQPTQPTQFCYISTISKGRKNRATRTVTVYKGTECDQMDLCCSLSCQKSLSRWHGQQAEMQVWVMLMSYTTERMCLSHNSFHVSLGFFSCFPLPGSQEVRTHGRWNLESCLGFSSFLLFPGDWTLLYISCVDSLTKFRFYS